jgi:hypothetical protein
MKICVVGDIYADILTNLCDDTKVFSYTIRDLVSPINRTRVERYVKEQSSSHVVFMFGSANEGIAARADILEYVKWVSNIPGRFYRLVVVPLPIPALTPVRGITPLYEQLALVRYYETVYDIKQLVAKYNVSRNMICVDLESHILDENLLPRGNYIDLNCQVPFVGAEIKKAIMSYCK